MKKDEKLQWWRALAAAIFTVVRMGGGMAAALSFVRLLVRSLALTCVHACVLFGRARAFARRRRRLIKRA